MSDWDEWRPETLAAQALGWIDEHTKAVVPPIHLATTYLRDPDNRYRSGRAYGRADNPSFDQPEALLAPPSSRAHFRLGHGRGDDGVPGAGAR